MRRSLLVAVLALVTAVSLTVAPAGASVASAGLVAAGMTPQQAVDQGAAEAADSLGATTYAAVVDRRTGKIVARTDNADTQVASESLVKVLLVSYYLVKYDGNLPTDMAEDLHTMIVESDDHLCTAYWTSKAVPAMAARYDLSGISLAEPDPGHWGATRITADGMAQFLYRASKDKIVGPWLLATMRETHDYGSDGFDQNFGFNAQPGAASKQGWGSDNWGEQANSIHSIGVTANYTAAVLQTGPRGTYRSLGKPATNTAQLIADATPPPLATTAPTTSSPPNAQPGPGGTVGWWGRALAF